MTRDTRDSIELILTFLRDTLIENNVSMATSTDGNIYFFDTSTYLLDGRMDGFHVRLDDLVKRDEGEIDGSGNDDRSGGITN